MPLLGCIADDFTGATDLASMLVRNGMRTVQLIGVPGATDPVPDADAIVVALKSRTIPAGEAVALSLAALDWLRAAGSRQFFFKYCSTFDSTAAGNIGPVADALIAALGSGFALACPAFPANARSVYQGHLFVGSTLLNESGMEHHPLTPMTDANLVRVLSRQTEGTVGLVPYAVVTQGPAAIRRAMTALKEQGNRYAIVDAVDDAHLVAIGAAAAAHALITGGSGVAMGLPANFRAAGLLPDRDDPGALPDVAGPAAVLAGSCSRATLMQIGTARDRTPTLELDPLAEPDAAKLAAQALAWAEGTLGDAPVVIAASAPPDRVAALQAKLGREAAGVLVETTLAEIAAGLVARGVRRIVVAGGETSGAVVSRLGVRSLRIGAEIDPRRAVDLRGGRRGAAAAGIEIGKFRRARFLSEGVRMPEDVNESELRDQLVAMAASLFARGFSVGSAGNISVRLADGFLITPTNSSLGRLDAGRLAKLDAAWRPLSGDAPSKEVFLHRAVYAARAEAGAVVHLHSTMATAVACLSDVDPDNPIPPLTPYFVMRVGRRLPVVPYYRPGDAAMEPAIHAAALGARAMLLANHGPVVSAKTLRDAVYAAEELEEAAKLFLLLRGADSASADRSASRGSARHVWELVVVRKRAEAARFKSGTGPHPHPATHSIILTWVAGWGCGPVPDFPNGST